MWPKNHPKEMAFASFTTPPCASCRAERSLLEHFRHSEWVVWGAISSE
jgi:hypothetical protein